MVKATVCTIQGMRADKFASRTFKYVSQLCEKNEFAGPSVLRKGIPSKLGGGDRTKSDKPENYYKCEILNRVLDTLTHQL